MNIFLCIDDTDQLGGPGTGKLLQALCEAIEKQGWGFTSPISRHQLFRFRGWYHLGRAGESMGVEALTSYPFIDAVMTEAGAIVPPDTTVRFGGDELKTVLKHHCQVLLVRSTAPGSPDGIYVTLTKQEVKKY